MPMIIYCDNFPNCQNIVAKTGLCADCKRRAEQYERDWRGIGWTRYEEREQIQHNRTNGKRANK